MARTVLAVQDTALAGLTPVYTAADAVNGMQFLNDGKTILHIKDTGVGACTVTLTTPAKVGGLDVADPTIVVPATTGDKMSSTLNPTLFNQADGNVYVDFSTATGVTVAALRVN